MSHLLRPYTAEEIKVNKDSEGYVSGNVLIDLSDVIDRDLEGFLDLISTKLIANDLLMDTSYKAVGVTAEGALVIEVTGDPSEVLNFLGENSGDEVQES